MDKQKQTGKTPSLAQLEAELQREQYRSRYSQVFRSTAVSYTHLTLPTKA